MEYIIVNGELCHHGTKGMKWGVRRFQNKDGSLTPAGKKRYNKEMEKLKAEQKVLKNKERTAAKLKKLDDMRDDIEQRKKKLNGDGEETVDPKKVARKESLKAKNPKNMTNEELTAYKDRLQLEKDYTDLVNKTHTVTLNKGKQFIEDVMKKSGENITTQLVTYGLGTAVNKLFNDDIVNPKKGQKDK